MYLLEGVRVVEIALWVAGPAVGGVLADWGAEVYKIEPPDGDPMRTVNASYMASAEARSPGFDLDNRGKRSVVLDLKSEPGLDQARRLIDTADVLVTNLRPSVLIRLGLDHVTLLASHPRLIYALITAQGLDGPDRDEPGYDSGAFWARSGAADRFTPPGNAPPMIAGAFGDHVTGITAVGAVMAGLYYRERHGVGQLVTTSLLRAGAYGVSGDLATRLALGRLSSPVSRLSIRNPLINCYRVGDGTWLWLLGAESQRHWPNLARAVGRPELIDDERFNTPQGRRRHGPELIALLDDAFSAHDRSYWAARFAEHGVWWAPVNTMDDLLSDPQARAAGIFAEMPLSDPDRLETVLVPATPIEFGAVAVGPTGPPPRLGQHTAEVLAQLGVSDG